MDSRPSLSFVCPLKEALSPRDGGFDCSVCEKHVVDFRACSQEEINQKLSQATESLCGAFRPSQLNPVGLRAAMVALLVTASATYVQAQTEERMPELPEPIELPVEELEGCVEEVSDEGLFGAFVEQMPQLQGEGTIQERLQGVIRMPRALQTSGSVFVKFVVEKDGTVGGIEVARGYDPLANAEALRAFQALNLVFEPGLQRGRPVRSTLMVPIIFQVE